MARGAVCIQAAITERAADTRANRYEVEKTVKTTVRHPETE
ncbi:hypothetical protein ACWD4L_25830 [Streptomyces sp. NPDC002596]